MDSSGAIDTLTVSDSINGVLEIENIEPLVNPLREHMYNVENIPRAFMIAGAILFAVMIIWFIDRVMVWSVNNSTRGEHKRAYVIPFYVFPMLVAVAFIIDYISIIFGIFKYPWSCFSVLLVKGSLFMSTSIWVMRVFDVPLAKIISFLASAARAWRNKDVEGLDKSINELTREDNKNGVNKKTLVIIGILVMASCLAPRRSVNDVQMPVVPPIVEVEKPTVLPETIRVYKSAFGQGFLVKRAGENRVRTTAKVDEDDEREGSATRAVDSTGKNNVKGIPVYYQDKRVGTFRPN